MEVTVEKYQLLQEKYNKLLLRQVRLEKKCALQERDLEILAERFEQTQPEEEVTK